MAEILDARVKQKTGVAADFAGYTLLEGEIALVRTSANGPVWNFKVGPGNFDSLDWSLQNPGAAQEADTSTVFPTGVPGLYIPTEDGTYEGVTVDLSAGYTQLIWDGSAMAKAEFPIDLAGYATKPEVDREALISSETVIESPQVIDNSLIVAGQILHTTGNNNGSVNWINTGKQPFNDDSGQGEQYTLSGYGFAGSAGANARILFYGTGVTYMPSDTIMVASGTAPLTFTRPVGAMFYAINIINSADVGSNPSGSPLYNSIMLERGTSASPPMDLGFFLDYNKLVNLPVVPFDTDEVIIRKTGTARNFYVYFHNGGANNIWFRVRFVRQSSPSVFTLVWRLDEAFIVQRNSDFGFTDITEVISTGVWENAIYTTTGGYTDALGSAHGCEMMDDVSFFLDGNIINLDSSMTGNFRCKIFEAYQSSFLKTSDGAGDIGRMTKHWRFIPGRISINQTIYWLGTLGIDNNSYLGMCAVWRINGASEQITDTGMANDEWKPYDISSSGFTNSLSTNDTDPSRVTVVVWGDRIRVQQTSDRGVEFANSGMRVANNSSPNYNKIYNRMGATTVGNGDVWESETVWDISVK